jgi:hypothetical protein
MLLRKKPVFVCFPPASIVSDEREQQMPLSRLAPPQQVDGYRAF